jgi:hypothetical protein
VCSNIKRLRAYTCKSINLTYFLPDVIDDESSIDMEKIV